RRHYPGRTDEPCSLVPGSLGVGLPRLCGGSAPALPVSGPAQRLLALRPACSPSRHATLFIEGFRRFGTPPPAYIVTGWNEPVPGRDFHPLWTSAFSPRTVGSPRGSLPEAPTEPDVRNYRIRLFGARLCYVTGTKRIRACGNG